LAIDSVVCLPKRYMISFAIGFNKEQTLSMISVVRMCNLILMRSTLLEPLMV
jgi:hypothetical protein